MTTRPQQGLSVNRLVKALLDKPEGSYAEVLTTDSGNEKKHIFKLLKNEGCGVPYFLIYSAENDEGETLSFRFYVTCRPSNLPGVTAKRWYILHSRKDRLVQKLHIHSFRNGVFFYCRLDYDQLYASQTLSRRNRAFLFHDYKRKKEALINSKQKLRLEYDGQPTRTAKRLEHYQNKHDYYQDLADQQLMIFALQLRQKAGR